MVFQKLHPWMFAVLAAGCTAGVPPVPGNEAVAIDSVPLTSIAMDHQPHNAPGCYRADRPLGSAASPTAEIATRGLDTFELLPGGRVERPNVGTPAGYTAAMAARSRESWRRSSNWNAMADSLHVRLSIGLSGWNLKLVRSADSTYEGVAVYLTDVVVRDTVAWRPPVVAVRVQRESCVEESDP